MDRESRYFTLDMESLRAVGGWAADCAERALSVYETRPGSDARPRAAIEGIREFAAGGHRTARLRTLALDAQAAARAAGDPAATAAARAAGLAAASAYTHPLVDVSQTMHIVGPAAYAALALELDHAGDPHVAGAEVLWAIEHAPAEAREVLLQMHSRAPGKSRLATVLYELDAGIRARTSQQDTRPGDLKPPPAIALFTPVLADAEEISDAVRESLSELAPWMPWATPDYSPEDAVAWIEPSADGLSSVAAFEFVIRGADGALLGACGLNHIDHENRRANLGYWVRTSRRGCGVATSAVRLLADWALRHTELERLEIVVSVANHRSQRVAESAGAQREGIQRSRLLLHGSYHDAVMYSIVREAQSPA